MAIREVLLSNTFEQQRQLINLIGTDVGDCQNLITPSKVITTSINQVVAGLVTLSGQTVQLENGTKSLPSLSFDSAVDLGIYKEGTTTLGISKSLYVGGDLTVDGNITFKAGDGTNGTLTFGDLNTDNIVFNADLNSHVIPNQHNTFDLGSTGQRWRNLYVDTTSYLNTLQVSGNATISGNANVNGGTVDTTATTGYVFNYNATTVNAFGAATNLNIGATTGTCTIKSPTVVGTQATQNLYNTVATTVNAFGAGIDIYMGITLSGVPGNKSTFTIRSDDTVLVGKLNVNGGEILSSKNSFDLLTNNSDVRIGSSVGTGTTVVNNALKVSGNTIDLTNQGVTISVKDNLNPALSIKEGANSYLDVQTTDGLEKIIVYKPGSFLDSISGTSATFTGNITASGVTVNGSLTVHGTTTTINSTVLNIDDINIILGDTNSPTPTDALSDGGGITLRGTTDKTITYNNTSKRWTTNIGLTVGGLTEVQQLTEVLNTKTSATGTVTHDYSTGAIWYHSSIGSNFTLNLTNVPTTNDRVITITLVLSQAGTGYYPNAFQIDGSAQTIKWLNNTTPTPSTNKVDTVSFSLIRTGSAWTVLGQLTAYN